MEKTALKDALVKYANKLDTADISRMNAAAQNVFSLMMEEWTRTRQTRIEIPISVAKKRIMLSEQRDRYIEKQVENILKSIVARSVVTFRPGKGFYCIAMIPRVAINTERTKIIAECQPEFIDVFAQLEDGFTEYQNTIFMRIRGKYAKNLYRIFRRYYRGSFSLPLKELNESLGLPENTAGLVTMKYIRRAVAELEKVGIYESISVHPLRADTRGAPIVSVEFRYKIAPEKAAELAGQEKIPGLDGAAGPSPQAPAAVPSGDPVGDPAPFAAEEPPFIADDVPHGHIDPRTGLYIPSAEELAARHRPEDDKPSWRPAYSKPDIPEAPPKCPLCGGEMVKRARNDGHEFWGCANFPHCRGTRDLDGTDTSKK